MKFRELRQWIAERDWREWDVQIERDAMAGKSDELRKKVCADDDEQRWLADYSIRS